MKAPTFSLPFYYFTTNALNYRTVALNDISHRRHLNQSCPISIHLSILTFSSLVMPRFLEGRKYYNEEVWEHKVNEKGAGTMPSALPLGDESNVSLSRFVWLAPALLFLHHLFTVLSLSYFFSLNISSQVSMLCHHYRVNVSSMVKISYILLLKT